jgi:hypothetical protein
MIPTGNTSQLRASLPDRWVIVPNTWARSPTTTV